MNIRVRLILAVMAVIAGIYPSRADDGIIARINKLSGYSQISRSHVSNIQQDSTGLMWFATWNGLVRYDGHSIYKYKPIQCSEGTIDSDRVYNIKFDTDGNILCVSSDNRLFKFFVNEGRFIDLSALIPGIADKKVTSMVPLKNGYSWVLFRDGTALRFSDDDPVSSAAIIDEKSGYGKIKGVKLTADGSEWILTDKCALNYSNKQRIDGKFTFIETAGPVTYLIDSNGMAVQPETSVTLDGMKKHNAKINYIRACDSLIVMSSEKGIYSLNTSSGRVNQCSATPTSFLYRDKKRRIWGFGNDSHVELIPHADHDKAIRLTTEKSSLLMKIKNPQLIFETGDGTVILKPAGGVLSSFDEDTQQLVRVNFNDVTHSDFAPDEMKKFLVDRSGNLWILYSEGIDCISFHRSMFARRDNPSRMETRALTIDSRGRQWLSDRTGRVSCGEFSIDIGPAYTIKESPEGEMWIGTKGNGVYRLIPLNDNASRYDVEHFTRSGSDDGKIQSDSVYDIAFINGQVWLGSYGYGLATGKPVHGKYHFTSVKNQPAGLKVRQIVATADSTLLVATADGLVTSDALTVSSPRFYINKYRPDSRGIKGNDVMSVVKCDGKYYVCVYGSGISRIDSESLLSDSLEFTTFTLPPSANADQIKSSVTNGSDIWIVTGGALTRFTPAAGSMTVFTPDNFLNGVAFSEAMPAIGNGVLIAGTSDGIISLDLGKLQVHEKANNVIVTGILYQNDMDIHPLNNPSEITLTPSQRSFSVLLSTVTYDSEAMPGLRYRLLGHDDGWNYPQGSQPAATYSDLSPGEYELVIEVQSPEKGWIESNGRLKVVVEPRFSETALFRFTMILLCAIVVTGLVIAVIYFMKMRNALQKKYSLLMMVGKISDRLDSSATKRKSKTDAEQESQKFIEKSLKYIDDNISNSELMVEDLARYHGMSRTAYYNMMKATTGLTPVDFIKQTRIKRALKYLMMNQYSISEVAYMVGFSDPKYFSRCFKAEMDMTPSQYMEQVRKETV